ncbi:hypothetical protein RN607_12355 [Demequina capsici]|uniref:Lipoprotein n=1 Tax=Demequina capsici TaxID=3075620 RepID=A0AA96J970_9MICO|nr:hypothetical protein [Demequina sp. PMTSA13]WNM26982.1 hypothetical protein RN607_12355 [Demequina sp. PMTSA13]
MTSFTRHTMRLTLGATLALAALTGCGTTTASDTLTPATGASSDATGPAAGTADAHAADSGEIRTAVGPILLGVPDRWDVLDTVDGATIVQAKGCAADTPCPAFAVLQGDAIIGETDPSAAYTQDGTGCPGGLAPQATDDDPTLTEVVIDGVDGTLAELRVDCTDDDGAVRHTVSQLQWYLPDAPGGPVLIVDRWSFDGLRNSVAGAAWVASQS